MAWEHIRPHGDVFVGIPHSGQVSTAWAINMLHALSPYLSGIRLFTIQGHPIDVSRNVLVEHALASGAEYIYYLDSDICRDFAIIDTHTSLDGSTRITHRNIDYDFGDEIQSTTFPKRKT